MDLLMEIREPSMKQDVAVDGGQPGQTSW